MDVGREAVTAGSGVRAAGAEVEGRWPQRRQAATTGLRLLLRGAVRFTRLRELRFAGSGCRRRVHGYAHPQHANRLAVLPRSTLAKRSESRTRTGASSRVDARARGYDTRVRRLVSCAALVGLIGLLIALAPAAPAGASSGFTAACAATPLMNNVPRGSEMAVEWQLCVMTNGRGSWEAQVKICGAGAPTTSCVGQRCNAHLLGRLHVELSITGTEHVIAQSREVLEPVTCKPSSFITTGWHSHAGSGWYCGTLWNHDALGFYAVVPGQVALGGDREHFASDPPLVPRRVARIGRLARARAARVPHRKAAGKWNSVCLGW